MLKQCIGSLLITSLLLTTAYCQNQPTTPAPIPEEITIETVVAPPAPLSNNWVFVVDTSSSLWSIFGRIRASFLTATQHPTDELFFAAITFNDRGMEKFRDWKPSSAQEFIDAEAWIARNRGVLSYGVPALRQALEQRKNPLTVVLITDGGFTEACYNRGFGAVREAIATTQQWRVNQGLPRAQICTIGIENPNYTAGGKPSDADCQAFLREIGNNENGGYFLVKGAAPHARGPGAVRR